MAFVGLLNCFHNALYAALNEKKQDQHHQQQQQQQQQTQKSGEKNIRGDGEEDAGYVLQLTFSDLGMTHVVASLCAVDDEVMTYSATRLGVVLLDGGNQRAQRALLNYFETHQEGFFHNIRDVLQKALRWVWRLNVEQQLVILERGGVIVNVSNLQHFMSMLLANVPIQSTDGGGSSSSSSINTNDRRRLSGWDRVQGCLRVRLIFTLFRMLQLFCEGHNLSMQNYIRSQHDNMHSVNLVHEVMVFLAEISTIIRPATVEVVRGGFELLTELCQGPCHANQEVLLSYDVCATICHVLDLLGSPEVAGTARTAATRNRSNNNTDPDASDLVAQCDRCLTKTDVGCLRTSLTTCLLSLTEGCRSPDTIRRILAQIPVEIIERELATVGPKMYDRILDDEEFEDDPGVEAFFKWLVFLHTVRPFAEGLYQQHVDEMLRRTAKISSRLLGHIEVRRADGQLEKVLFRIPLSCCGLTQSTKDGVLWSVNRTSRATKLGDFLHQSDNLIFEVERAHAFQRWVARWTRFRLGGSDSDDKMGEEEEEKEGRLDAVKRGWNRFIAPVLFSSQLSFYEYASIAVAVIVNTSLISVEGARWNDGMVLFWKDMLTFLCFLQFVLSCIVLGVDAVIFFPVCLYTEYRRKQHLTSGRAKLNATMQEVFDGMTVKEIVKLFFTRFTIQFRLFLVIMAALSVLVSHYFAAAHLLLVIYKTPTLRTFISAITQNGRQLLLTAFLGVVVLYLFAIVGYLVFSRGFGNEEGTNEENCGTLLRCFTFILWQGLRQGGGVGDVMEEESWTSTTFLPRVSYDLIFFALVNVVFLNIMFGLIIDTFGELRDDKREKETDMRSTCFICGLDAERFEKARIGGFRAHVNQEHNMWMYLYFMSYLRRKDPNDFTGQESYVHERIQQNDLGFFPEEECLLLQEDEDRLDAAEDEQQDVAGVDERGTARRGPAAAAATAAGGGADAQAVALTLKELAGAKEALSVFVRDIGADAQKVKTMLRQLEITSRSIQGTSVNGAGTQGTRSVTGTHVSKEGS
ncbi:inositol 1,4,5-trisphosphate receptor [Trypanosoma grayi]|uniref:inositol 1,4,5-trisphosphate receptor n=1 Tax=Trypanosoma grayi TaxID=71804 RepID=UPI0004F43D7A|nr:inositol 1,4,5-trisphosphate receptor [Trypanosoma grayi]KEG09002.1 inositol 1,4,5-trisphosphate receptor [Trypanosoma grayi]